MKPSINVEKRTLEEPDTKGFDQPMWKYSVTGLICVIGLQITNILILKTFNIGSSIFQALIVAYGIAWWFARTEKRPLIPRERKQLLLQYSILVGIFFVALDAIWASQHQATPFGHLMLMMNWLPYPVFIYLHTRNNRIQRHIPRAPVTPININRRSKYLNKIYYILAAQITLGVLLALFTPANILTYAWARKLVEGVLGSLAPKMLTVPAASTIPQVVLFYHATMLATWPIFTLIVVYIIYSAPKYEIKSNENFINKSNINKSSLLIGYFLIAVLFLFFPYILSSGYRVGPYGDILWLSRGNLLIATSIWFVPTLYILILATAPGVIRMYWNVVPWRSKR
jgi:hypothetical protein